MRSQNRLLLVALIAVALLIFAVWSTPFTVASSVRLWLWWQSRQQGVAIRVDKVDAPLLRPVVLRGLRITSPANAARRVDVDAPFLTVGLDLKSILLRRHSPPVPSISASGLRIVLRQDPTRPAQPNAALWRTLAELVPDTFSFDHVELRFERGSAVILLHDLTLAGNEIEAGRFKADQLVVASPWMRQTFGQLRGATKWEERRLTVAGVTLAPGVDLPAFTLDLSQLSRAGIAAKVDAELFGGTMRLDVAREASGERANWKLVGAGSDISLAQAPTALGFNSALAGIVRACKFTLRGDLLDLANTTGWIWTELRDPKWKQGSAEVLMLGAAMYNRQIDLDQLYIKQAHNELTVSGGTTIPRTASKWVQGSFRLDVAASIGDLSELAGLLGANPADYRGQLTANGSVTAQNRTFSGEFDVTGRALELQGRAVDMLRANAAFAGRKLELRELTLRRDDDFVNARGTFDLAAGRAVDGIVDVALANSAEYLRSRLLRGGFKAMLQLHGRTASVESLTLTAPAGDVEFSGTVDFAALDDITVTLRPSQNVRVGFLPDSGCVTSVEFARPRKNDSVLPAMESIALRRRAHSRTWSMSLLSDAGPRRSTSLCRGARGQQLELFIGTDSADGFAKAVRAFHAAVGDPLSLLPPD